MTIKSRLSGQTPKFFKKVRTIGLILAAAGGAILTAPATLGLSIPAAVVSIGSYLALGGAVASAVSQLATTGEIE
jgi:hypothetical protein